MIFQYCASCCCFNNNENESYPYLIIRDPRTGFKESFFEFNESFSFQQIKSIIINENNIKNYNFKKISQYIILKKIGEGSYGKIYLAYNEDNQQFFAIKSFSKSILHSRYVQINGKLESHMKKVKTELSIMLTISDHPHIISFVNDIDEVDSSEYYFVTEYAQKGALHNTDEISHPVYSEDSSRKYFIDLMKAVSYCHQQGIVHCDIKPENLFIDENNRLKLGDFGEAIKLPNTMNDHIIDVKGTIGFMAPEVIKALQNQNNKHLEPIPYSYSAIQAEIWACGASLFCLVFGHPPFCNNSISIQECENRILYDSLTFPQNITISNQLLDLLQKILVKNPTCRLSLPEIIDHPWMSFV